MNYFAQCSNLVVGQKLKPRSLVSHASALCTPLTLNWALDYACEQKKFHIAYLNYKTDSLHWHEGWAEESTSSLLYFIKLPAWTFFRGSPHRLVHRWWTKTSHLNKFFERFNENWSPLPLSILGKEDKWEHTKKGPPIKSHKEQ